MREANLETYDLAVMVLSKFDKPSYTTQDKLWLEEKAHMTKETHMWDRLNARLKNLVRESKHRYMSC